MTAPKQLAGWVGSTSYAAKEGRGDHPGCVCKSFSSVKAFNQFFEKNPTLMVVDVQYVPGLFGVRPTVMYTNQLDPQELADLNEVSRETEFAMAKRRAEREAKRQEDNEVANKTKQEMARLATVGSKYEARVKHIRTLSPSDPVYKDSMKKLNAGDPDILNDEGKGHE